MSKQRNSQRRNDPDARMQLRGIGDLRHPGACAVCGSGNCDSGYVDLGVYYEYEGWVYLCLYCIEEAGGVVDMLTVNESEKLIEAQHKAEGKALALEEENGELHERLNGYVSVIADAVTYGGNPDRPDTVPSKQEPETTKGTAKGRKDTEPAVTESTKKSGPAQSAQSESSNPVPASFSL